jgi:uncharacterized protein (TIGR03435 family)
MKTLFLCLTAAIALQAQPAPDIAGTWQGTLSPAPERSLRVVFRLERNNGNLAGALFNIDQNPQPIPLTNITFQGGTLKFAIAPLGATYEGKLAANGNSVTGTVTQNDRPMALNLDRATPQTAWAIPEPPPPPKPIAANAQVHVEVATVKPSDPNARGRLYTFRGDQVMSINTTVMNLVTFAYDLRERQVAGLPGWASDLHFDITIKPDTPGQPSFGQMKKLFQEVLADRFQLKTHTEKRQINVYAITLPPGAKHKLTPSSAQSNLPNMIYRRPGLLPAQNATMLDLAQSMQTAVLDRPVIDRTGIEGRYDFTLDWMPDETQFQSFGPQQQPLQDNGKPNIFQAYQEQLGLKLEATQAPADVMVIDKVEKPGEN